MDKCVTCRYWDRDGVNAPGRLATADDVGETKYCRKFPLAVAKFENDWCGEHKREQEYNGPK